MSAKDLLSGKRNEEEREAKKPTGSGTRLSGYVDYPTVKACQNCEYFVDGGFCKNKVVLRDKQVKTDKKRGLKIVDPINGCCNRFEPEDE